MPGKSGRGDRGRPAEALEAVRRRVLEVARETSRTGLSPGRSGNVSERAGEGMVVTPSGLAYDDLEPADMVLVDGEGRPRAGERHRPSSEWRFHLSVYRARPDVGGVVHTHSLEATALACAHRSIPAFHYMVAVAGGDDIPLVPYATFGTEELAALVAAGLAERDACLLANHGQLAVGRDARAALDLAREVETLAAQYVRVLAIGGPAILDPDEMARVRTRFAGYGQRGGPASRGTDRFG
jgi:ribulose-5-phosphate 4-epimerase/fuculose-1-phosphate aldolase